MDHRQVREAFYEVLAEEGFRPTYDEDDDIIFRYEGKTVIALVDEDDLEYLRLVLPNVWELEDTEEWNTGVLAAMLATQRVKCAKVWVEEDQTHVSVEFFLEEVTQLRPMLNRYLRSLEAGAQSFAESMREMAELREDADDADDEP